MERIDLEKDEDYLERSRQINIVKNYFFLGCNFGPYKSEGYKKKYIDLLSKCKDVCFRDKSSFEEFKELRNVRYSKDIVFTLKPQLSSKKDYILISVIKPSHRKDLIGKDLKYFNKIADISIQAIEKGKNVKFISFCKAQGDEDAIEVVLKLIPKNYTSKISKYFYHDNINEALNIFKYSEIVIATRFHASILGFIYEKPVFPIAYDSKTIHVLEDLNFPGGFVDFNNLESLSFENIVKNKSLDKLSIERLNKEALMQFEILDKYLV